MRKYFLLDRSKNLFRPVSLSEYWDCFCTLLHTPSGLDIVPSGDSLFYNHRVDIYQNDILIGFSYEVYEAFMKDITKSDIIDCLSICYVRSVNNLGCRGCMYNPDKDNVDIPCQKCMLAFSKFNKDTKDCIHDGLQIPRGFWG